MPKLLNHLARKDAARLVKLLCLAAGSPSADRTHGIREVEVDLPIVSHVFYFSVSFKLHQIEFYELDRFAGAQGCSGDATDRCVWKRLTCWFVRVWIVT